MPGNVNFHTLVFPHGWKMKAEALSPLHPPIQPGASQAVISASGMCTGSSRGTVLLPPVFFWHMKSPATDKPGNHGGLCREEPVVVGHQRLAGGTMPYLEFKGST